MRADAVARNIAEIFKETDAEDLKEITVTVSEAKAIAAALKRLDFVVKTEQRAGDFVLTVTRGASRPKKSERANEKRG